jgi:hypothetical protein
MHQLQIFSPRLVGAVLDGTAGPHSRICFHVFCDAPENLVLFLADQGLTFDQEQRQIRWHDGSYRIIQVLVIEVDGKKAELAIFSPVDLRQAPPAPLTAGHTASLVEVGA